MISLEDDVVAYIYSRIFLYLFLALFIYAVLNLFTSLVISAYEASQVWEETKYTLCSISQWIESFLLCHETIFLFPENGHCYSEWGSKICLFWPPHSQWSCPEGCHNHKKVSQLYRTTRSELLKIWWESNIQRKNKQTNKQTNKLKWREIYISVCSSTLVPELMLLAKHTCSCIVFHHSWSWIAWPMYSLVHRPLANFPSLAAHLIVVEMTGS